MQNRYVPDLGDLGKFGLIRALARPGAPGGLRVGLAWYLVDLGEANNDGRHVTYLDAGDPRRAALRDCDPVLFDAVAAIRNAGEQHVAAYRLRAVAGAARSCTYFEEPLGFEGTTRRAERERVRGLWLERAAAAVDGCDLVLLDPDNGLEVASVHPSSPRGVKYATLGECARFFDPRRRSLVVYQHASRRGSVVQQAEGALARLAGALGTPRDRCFALRFHRGTSRLYLVVPAAAHRDLLRARARAMVRGPWGRNGHFTLLA